MLLWGFFIGCKSSYHSCFIEGTQVTMESGFTRNIEDLRSGDTVLSYNVQDDVFVDRKVRALIRSSANELYTLESESVSFEGVTAEHPFYQPDMNLWVPVNELRQGDLVLVTRHGRTRSERIVKLDTQFLDESVDVYNLTVEGPEHNYFANDVLVHNKSIAEPFFDMEINDLIMDWTYPLGEEHILEGEHTLAGLLSFTVDTYMYSPIEDSDPNSWIANFRMDMNAIDLRGVEESFTIDDCIEPFEFTVEDLDNNILSKVIECEAQFKPGSWQVVGTVSIDGSHEWGESSVTDSFDRIIEVYENDQTTDTGE